MELKVEIGFDELLSAIKQLPQDQRAVLKKELDKKEEVTPEKNKRFKEFLLNGPVMSDKQYKEFKETRKRINQWRSK